MDDDRLTPERAQALNRHADAQIVIGLRGPRSSKSVEE
jgi:hypothetical protein